MLIFEQDFGPILSAVSGAIDAALCIRAKGMSQGRNVSDVRVFRMHGNAPDGPCLPQSGVRPGFAGVYRFVDAASIDNVATNTGFARSRIDYVRVRRRYCNR